MNIFKSYRRGFSLTEIAIVLSVIGLIIGAIWTIAGMVRLNYAVNNLGTNISYIISKFEGDRSFSTANFPTNAVCQPYSCPPNTCYYASSVNDQSNAAVTAGLIPQQMYNAVPEPGQTMTLKNFFGGIFTVQFYIGGSCAAPGGGITGPATDYVILLTGPISSAACVRLLTANTPAWYKSGFVQICTGGPNNDCAGNLWFGNDVTLVTPDFIKTACSVDNPVYVHLTFNWPFTAS